MPQNKHDYHEEENKFLEIYLLSSKIVFIIGEGNI